jgi:RNA ligase (TIGR02306 family)
MRKLATIRKIKSLHPIPKKDRIVKAIVDGWSVIVKKDEFTEDSLCVFFEIDSFLPAVEPFTFLPKPTTYKGNEGYRLKTMKMSGVISQGLALPLHMFESRREWNDSSPYSEGDDVTELLGVIKYDVAEVAQTTFTPGKAKGKFPSFIPKTDQERVQNLTHYFDVYKDHEFEETLKLDGSSMTCYCIPKSPTLWDRVKSWFGIPFKDYHFGVCSHNLEIKPDANYETTFDNGGKSSTYKQSDFWKAAIKYDIERALPVGYAIQGELIGPKIQSNHEKVHDLEYHIFDIFNITEGRYLTPSERAHMMSGSLQRIPHTPVVSPSVKIFSECPDLDSLLKRVEGQSINPGTISEGRVYKSTTVPHLTFKVISNKYLLKCEA